MGEQEGEARVAVVKWLLSCEHDEMEEREQARSQKVRRDSSACRSRGTGQSFGFGGRVGYI